MSQGTCLLCFSVAKVFDIKHTHLQNVYEKLSDNEIQADSHALCSICYTKLLQCKELLKHVQESNSDNQANISPLVQLSTFNTDNKIYDFEIDIELESIIKEEYIDDADMNSEPEQSADGKVMKVECIKGSPDHYGDDTLESFEDKLIATQMEDDDKPYACHVSEAMQSYKNRLRKARNEEKIRKIKLEIAQLNLKHLKEMHKLKQKSLIIDKEIAFRRAQVEYAKMKLELLKVDYCI